MNQDAGLDRQAWERIDTIFHRALALTAAERAAMLDQVCGSDFTVRREVDGMLRAHEQGHGLLAERRLALDGLQPPREIGLAAGTRVGPYRIIAPIGAGGMGDVYRAERADGAYRQTVALKVLRPGHASSEAVRRFRIEREALGRLVHPRIAAILDGGTMEDGRPYIVLQFVDGVPITAYCAERALDVRQRLALFLDVASAVQFAHGRLVVHRDIKPSNILVEDDGTPRLLDFGIAKLLDLTDVSFAVETKSDARLLTVAYAAPEQLRGDAPTTATDVYALGALLFEMLTEVKPFAASARTPWTLEAAVLERPAPTPSSVAASRAVARALHGDLDRVLLMALRKEPERRYVSAAQFAEDVARYLAGRPVLAQPDSVRYRARRFMARNRVLVAGGALVMLLVATFAVTAAVQARRISRERDRAERERVAADDAMRILTGVFERADPNKHPGGDTLRVTALLDDAEREVARLHDDAAREAALWRAVGRMRAARGEYARAIVLLGRAYDRRRTAFGTGDVEAARIHHDIAQARVTYLGYPAGRAMLDSSLRELRALLGDDDADVRNAMTDLLAATYDSVAARKLLAQLLELERRAPSHDPVAIGNQLDARGSDLFAEGRFGDAARLFEAAVAAYARTLPDQHELVRSARQDWALALSGAGELARAESLQRAAVATEDRLHGSPVGRGAAHEALALTLVGEKRTDAAEVEERQALRFFREGAAPGHTRIWSAARNVAFILAARGRVADGLAMLDTAIDVARAGPDSGSSTGYLYAQRVPFLLQLGRAPDAARSLAEGERLLGNSSVVSTAHRADVHRYAGMIELATGHPDRALVRFRAAAALTEPTGAPPIRVGINSCLVGIALSELGRPDEARALVGAPCAAYESRGVPNPLIVSWIASARARIGLH